MRVYEGLIVFDSKEASTNWDSLKAQVIDILKKHGCEVLRERKWSDRKLAYDIKGCKRGTYLLIHFVGPAEAIHKIRADMKLAETVLRELIIRLDITREAFEKSQAAQDAAAEGLETAAPAAAPAAEAPASASTTADAEKAENAKSGEKAEEVKV